VLDGFTDWDPNWTVAQVELIRDVRVIILGRTANKAVSVSGTPTGGSFIYRRPKIADSEDPGPVDLHKRYLLESTANIRNMSLNIYNSGVR